MKIKTIDCPCCGASVESDIQGRDSVFCNYCGKQIDLQDDNSTTKNINISKNIKIHKKVTNNAEVIRAQAETKRIKNDLIAFVVIMCSFLLIAALCIGIPSLINVINKTNGKLNAGYYKDLVGEDYKAVQAHFESAGFVNIELVDLDDAGLFFWEEGKVKFISVGGDTDFDSSDWFAPDTKVVISYR